MCNFETIPLNIEEVNLKINYELLFYSKCYNKETKVPTVFTIE